MNGARHTNRAMRKSTRRGARGRRQHEARTERDGKKGAARRSDKDGRIEAKSAEKLRKGAGDVSPQKDFFPIWVSEKSATSCAAPSPLGTVTLFQGALHGIVNVPAQVARAQEGSLLRRLECLSCPCSG